MVNLPVRYAFSALATMFAVCFQGVRGSLLSDSSTTTFSTTNSRAEISPVVAPPLKAYINAPPVASPVVAPPVTIDVTSPVVWPVAQTETQPVAPPIVEVYPVAPPVTDIVIPPPVASMSTPVSPPIVEYQLAGTASPTMFWPYLPTNTENPVEAYKETVLPINAAATANPTTGAPSTSEPVDSPSASPSGKPSLYRTYTPVVATSQQPSWSPSSKPIPTTTDTPISSPSQKPSGTPSGAPSYMPITSPSWTPSGVPSMTLSTSPSDVSYPLPTVDVMIWGFLTPDNEATNTVSPSWSPTSGGTEAPMNAVVLAGEPKEVLEGEQIASTGSPSGTPTHAPSDRPSDVPSSVPSDAPSVVPSDVPSSVPSDAPSVVPSDVPSSVPSDAPSVVLSDASRAILSDYPSSSPSGTPSDAPSVVPSDAPSVVPSDAPSVVPSDAPSVVVPSDAPSVVLSDASRAILSDFPSSSPSGTPSYVPSSDAPSALPSFTPSDSPSYVPSDTPSSLPSDTPSFLPSDVPSISPKGSPVVSEGEVYDESIGNITLGWDDIGKSCAEFLLDFMPLVYPANYTDVTCVVVSQSSLNESLHTRALQEETVIAFRTRFLTLILKAVSSVNLPNNTEFQDVVMRTFVTFGTEFGKVLTKSTISLNAGDTTTTIEGATPIMGDRSQSSDNEINHELPWETIGVFATGGAVLALVVAFLILKRRERKRLPQFLNSYQCSKSVSKSASNRLSKSDSDLPFRDWSEPKASLPANNDTIDDFMMMATLPLANTPLPEPINIPQTVENSQLDITSELSPASYFGECGCLKQTTTYDAVLLEHDADLENAINNQAEPVERTRTVDSTELHGLNLVDTSVSATASRVDPEEIVPVRRLSRLSCAKPKNNGASLIGGNQRNSDSIDMEGVLSDCEGNYSSDEVFDELNGLDYETGSTSSYVMTPRHNNRKSAK